MPKISDLDLGQPSKKRKNFFDLIEPKDSKKIKENNKLDTKETKAKENIKKDVKKAENNKPSTQLKASVAIKKKYENNTMVQPGYSNGTEMVQDKYKNSTTMVKPGYNKNTEMVQDEYKNSTAMVKPRYNKNTNNGTESGTNNSLVEGVTFGEIYGISGIKDQILKYIVNICAQKGTLVSLPISSNEIADIFNINKNSVKVAIKRLKKEGLIVTLNSKRGKYACYQITEEVKKHVLDKISIEQKEEGFNLNYTIKNKSSNSTNNGSNNGTGVNVVSSSNINTNTTLPEEWRTLDIECLESKGFKESNLIQVYNTYKRNPEVELPIHLVQESIYAFSFDLEHNLDKLNIKTSAAAMITNILKKGNPYSSYTPESFMTPKELQMKKYIDSKKLREVKLKKMEEEMFNLEMDDWLNNLDISEKSKILSTKDLPNNLKSSMKKKIENGHLQTHFEENVWPNIKQSVMSGNKETVI